MTGMKAAGEKGPLQKTLMWQEQGFLWSRSAMKYFKDHGNLYPQGIIVCDGQFFLIPGGNGRTGKRPTGSRREDALFF